MSIVLSVLQIIGWILFVALLVVVLALLVILFWPVHYLVDIHWLEEQWAKFRAHWFFHVIRARVSYADDLIYGEIGILWKKISFSFDLTSKKEEEKEEEPIEETETTENDTEEAKSEKESIISRIKGMIERIKEVYPKLKKIITDGKNKEAVVHLKDELLYLLKILFPKKSKVDAVFSTGSPDTTGQLFGVLACFPAMYQKDWKLLPDFESDDMYFEGTFWGKGRIHGCQIVGIILRIVFDKNCRRLYTMINKFIKWLKKSDKSEGK